MLTLREALVIGRLDDFIAQEEARGIPAADTEELIGALENLIKAPQSEDQTSRSSSHGGSSGK